MLLVKWLVNLLLEKYLKLEFSSRVLGDVVVDPLKSKETVEVAESESPRSHVTWKSWRLDLVGEGP